MQAVGEEQAETLRMVHVGPSELNNLPDSGGRELETCYEKMPIRLLGQDE